MSAKLLALGLMAAALASTGCSVHEKNSNGNDDVKIETPFGGMKVKTNDAVVAADVGLAVYPGATVVKKDKDNDAADVDMNFGNFHLRVRAISYRTDDSSEKVTVFYRKELSRYGDVITCKGDVAVGTPTKTSDGLGCADNDKHVHYVPERSDIQLKAGGKIHQHIVAIEKQPGGTKFGLVMLDLPKGEKESN